ncbi:hypothetical protein L6452_43899 [Arctium lappa]|uniref:Uncharacterized protein n=1 Tax=Arctium lappa TaxID=4217 RepID=A0ACB8XI65_ARCLA|nr:hypothetical protein L6452_43899 [Arctium lappa]
MLNIFYRLIFMICFPFYNNHNKLLIQSDTFRELLRTHTDTSFSSTFQSILISGFLGFQSNQQLFAV